MPDDIYVNVFKRDFYFSNGVYREFLADAEAARVYITNEYIVFIPAPKIGAGTYAFSSREKRNETRMRMPQFIIETMPKVGKRKVYKYRDGFAIKRYETIGDKDGRKYKHEKG